MEQDEHDVELEDVIIYLQEQFIVENEGNDGRWNTSAIPYAKALRICRKIRGY